MTSTIINIIKKVKPAANITEGTKLLEEKVLDSLAMIALVAELSDEFDVDITAQHIIPENFETVGAIAALIEKLEDED